MQIVAKCPRCDAGLPVDASEAPASIKCGGCGREIGLSFSDALRRDALVDVCPVCGGAGFYIRLDFGLKVGLIVGVIVAAAFAAFYLLGLDFIAYSILAFAVLVDLVVYGRLGDVTVCYRCHSEFRGKYSRTALHFDLHTADVLELEYERRVGRR